MVLNQKRKRINCVAMTSGTIKYIWLVWVGECLGQKCGIKEVWRKHLNLPIFKSKLWSRYIIWAKGLRILENSNFV